MVVIPEHFSCRESILVNIKDAHADATMSVVCQLISICDHVRCVSAQKSDVGSFFTHFCKRWAKNGPKQVKNWPKNV